MGIFRVELYKILRRRMLWGGLAAILILMGLWLGMTVSDTDTVVDGVRYTGTEAIRKDREIARQWEGVLTMDELYAIIDTYGLAEDESAEPYAPRTGNWVSRFATDLLTDYRRKEAGEPVSFLEKEELENLAWRLETYTPHFCYMDQVDFLYEMNWTANLLLLLLLTVTLSPVFTEEYQRGTACVLLTTAGGKGRTMRSKLLAALAVAEGAYLLVNGAQYFAFFPFMGRTVCGQASRWPAEAD